ncbi:hypothetical protein [Caenibius sp. WL]|uniref:hypothetical protein n=1 Tax=Caenibius sp. WL TaxID=2872646 RepID=UPI001C99D535|nr:hypothetical protein [Caenibius sp. WL]QZP07810.1 hypothetical protein K5X80_14325 [Caenibius sp. WL]QZP09958.1 hypothetical protein K5X80_16880 [Caenibius sp. WL]
MTAHVRFKQADVKRAAAGTIAAGLPIAKIEIDPNGKIVIITGSPKSASEVNEWADLE